MHGRGQVPPHSLVDRPQNQLCQRSRRCGRQASCINSLHDTGTREKGQDWPELTEAAIGRHAVVVRLLLDKGAAASDAALPVASHTGHLEVVKLLLRYRDSAEQPPGNEPNALHMAARFGHVEVAELLLKRGANTEGGSADARLCCAVPNAYCCPVATRAMPCNAAWLHIPTTGKSQE